MKETVSNKIPQKDTEIPAPARETVSAGAPVPAEETVPAGAPVSAESAQPDEKSASRTGIPAADAATSGTGTAETDISASGDVYSVLESADTSEASAPDDVYSILGSAEMTFVSESSSGPADQAFFAQPGFPRFSNRTKNILLAVLPALFLALLLFPFLSGSLPRKRSGSSDPRAGTPPPTIMLTRDNRYYIRRGEEYEEEGYAAYDNLDGDLTRQVEVSINGDYVRYRVSDSAGNITVRFRRIPYRDSSPDEDE